MKSDLFRYLDEVEFAEKDPTQIESEILKLYEDETGRTLARGDPVRLFLNAIILALIQQRNVIDIAAKNNLLAYATGSYLDHLGALLGVQRLGASHAECTVRFTLSEEQEFDVIIPEGVRVSTGDGHEYTVNEEAKIPAGFRDCEVIVISREPGESGNGYVSGQVNRLVDIFPYEMSVRNIDETVGGSDIESDENYRERIQIAPESFSSAGPTNAYAYYARSAHNDIIDVAVIGPPEIEPGHVDIYPLMTGGNIPSDEIIQEVYEICNASDIRPDTDYVQVKKPEVIEYELEVQYWIDEKESGNALTIESRVESAISAWEKWQRVKLGRDINVSELTRRIIEAGAKRCEIISPSYEKLSQNQIAISGQRKVTYKGLEEA